MKVQGSIPEGRIRHNCKSMDTIEGVMVKLLKKHPNFWISQK